MTKKMICAFDSCKKKLNIVDCLSYKCKCDHVYCRIHRLPEKHNCSYDFIANVNKEKEIAKLKCVLEYDKL